jgi:thiol-disulfide isomerase/thioredoxin
MPTKYSHSRKAVRSRRRIWWIGGVLALVGFIVLVLAATQDARQVFSFSATTVTGERISLDDYRGKVVMLNFWATWCPPCRAEMPGIERVYEQYHDQGFTVLAVNNAERATQVSAFASQYGLTFPVLLDYSADIQQQFGIKGYPTSLFLDGAGKVYAIHPGAATVAQLTNYIETGLQRSAASG